MLKEIKREDFTEDRDEGVILSNLILSNYGWMGYTIQAFFILNGIKTKVIFRYYGFKNSDILIDANEEIKCYQFDSDILLRSINDYLTAQINDNKLTMEKFDGYFKKITVIENIPFSPFEKIIFDLYNQVAISCKETEISESEMKEAKDNFASFKFGV